MDPDHQYNIVIVDDDHDILKSFSNYLTKKFPNIHVRTCAEFNENCITDCNIKKCDNIDALLIDYYLSGNVIAPDIVKRIRKENKDLLIIVMSSMFISETNTLNIDIMKKALNCGANRAIPKDILEVTDTLLSHFKIRKSPHTVGGE